MRTVCFTIDIEPDCPPYLATQYRGVSGGLPLLLDLLAKRNVAATCFCTGDVAERFPEAVRELLGRGHELGSHGHTHRRFDEMPAADADAEIATSSRVLRGFGARVTSFRAPNLQLPRQYLPVLERHGFTLDSSQARYKADYYRRATHCGVTRIPASVTSSVLRLPRWIRDPWLLALESPVVLFVHPWEFVDLRSERLRLDCRFRTGNDALRSVDEVLALFEAKGAAFRRMGDLPAQLAA
jgi:peptidoglycan-N-acetylglucosamine deacetylase